MNPEYIDKVWKDIEFMFADYFGSEKPLEGIEILKKRWKYNKAWLFPFFDEEGRKSIEIGTDYESVSWTKVFNAFDSVVNMKKNLCEKELFFKVLYVDYGNLAFKTLREFVRKNFSPEEIARNRFDRDQPLKVSVGDKWLSLEKEGKVSRIVKKFFEVNNFENAKHFFRYYSPNNKEEDYQVVIEFMVTLYSQVVSALKLPDAIATLSINPLDIIMGSSHTSGDWRSCHNVFDGQWRTGQLSYLLDRNSAIAYTYTYKQPFCLNRYKIQDQPLKLWRQMVYFNKKEGAALLSKQYPSNKDSYSEAIVSLTKDILSKWSNTKEFEVRSNYENNLNCCEIEHYRWHYKDSPSILVRPKANPFEIAVFKTGASKIPCLICGFNRSDMSSGTARHYCNNCYNKYTCQCCNKMLIGKVKSFKGSIYCEDCFINVTAKCAHCNELNMKWSIVNVLNSNDERISVCRSCLHQFYTSCTCCHVRAPIESMFACKGSGSIPASVCKRCLEAFTSPCKVCGTKYLRHLLIDNTCSACSRNDYSIQKSWQYDKD